MLIEITSRSDKAPKEIADVVFKRLNSISGLINGHSDLSISKDTEDTFIIIFKQDKETQIRKIVQQLELELNFSTKWIIK